MKLTSTLVEATLLERTTRFSTLVELRGQPQLAHLPNSGRLEGCLQPGARVLLAEHQAHRRRTGYDLVMALVGEVLVSVDARLPTALVAEAFSRRALAPFAGYTEMEREVTWGGSRIDLLFSAPARKGLVEVKSVTLVRGGRALFPDAPTLRGRRQLATLVQAQKQGYEAAIIFVVQRPDAFALHPNAPADPYFAQALREAVAQGVVPYAYTCQVSPDEITLTQRIPVFL
ncbi:MAG TPA: DNA/RNA nuclease SfsA [Dehalococcoidia bacterium]|nr:DNA/RNA nuclease SfsA [Dehalococcoidia bacterium]